MPTAACPSEDLLLARARQEESGARRTAGAHEDPEGLEAHLAGCADCRFVLAELARGSRSDSGERETDGAASGHRELSRPRIAQGDLVDGKYRVDTVLGRGGMGLVLGATHEVLGSRVAIKVPMLAMRDDPEVRARLLREARVVARLEGEYVGRALDAGVLPGGFPFVVFEHLVGRTLAERLREEGPLPVQGAVDAVLEACAGLFVAHAAGIVHRDVKPSNLFEARRADGTVGVRVIDFGIAKTYAETDTLTRSRVVLGTPAYMAPEQVLAAREVDGRADVWALGMTLLELVTGRSPTVASFAARLGQDAGSSLAREIGEVGASRREAMAVAAIIARCLRDRPEDRYATVSALAHALAPLAGARGAKALQSIEREPVAAPRARSRRPVVAVASGLACAAAVAAWAFLATGPSPAASQALARRAELPADPAPLHVITSPSRDVLPAQADLAVPHDAALHLPAAASHGAARKAAAKPLPPAPASLAAPADAPSFPAHDENGLGDRK